MQSLHGSLQSFLFFGTGWLVWSLVGYGTVDSFWPHRVFNVRVSIVFVWATVTGTFVYVVKGGWCHGSGVFFCAWIGGSCGPRGFAHKFLSEVPGHDTSMDQSGDDNRQ